MNITTQHNTLRAALLLLMISLCMPSATAQTKKKKKDPPSQTLSAAWAPVQIDHYFGVRGGYGGGSIRPEPTRQTQMLPGLAVGGLTYRFDVPAQKYVGAIEADLNWSQKGYITHKYYDSEEVYSRRYNTIELPILWQPYLPLGKGGSRFFLSAGPFISYAFGSTFKEYNNVTGEVYSSGKYEYDPTRDNRWEYGITAGGGFLIAIKSFAVSLEFRYNIDLSDTYKSITKYPGNPFRSPVDQMNIALGVNYRLPISSNNPHREHTKGKSEKPAKSRSNR